MTPDEPIFKNERWSIRVVAGDPMYFYVDGPYDGVDDDFIGEFFNWDLYDIIYLFGDYAGLPKRLANKTVIKQSSHKNDNSICCFYQVKAESAKPIAEAKFFASFQGTLQTNPVRFKVLDALKQFESYHFEPTKFWTTMPIAEQQELRVSYLANMNDSQFVLCPRGAGLSSIRFFEALRMGRIPVLIADETKLPLEWLINYDNFIVRVPEADILQSRDYVGKWLNTHSLESASQQARDVSVSYFEDLGTFLKLVDHGEKVSRL